MSKLVAKINAANKNATVAIDGNNEVVCPIKKEGNGAYTIVLKGKVEFPRKFITFTSKGANLAEYDGQTIERDSDELKVRATGSATPSTKSKKTETEQDLEILKKMAKWVKQFGFDIDEMVEELDKKLNEKIKEEKAQKQCDDIDKQIAKLMEQKSKLLGQ